MIGGEYVRVGFYLYLAELILIYSNQIAYFIRASFYKYTELF